MSEAVNLAAERTVSMILAHVMIDMTVCLARNSNDIRIVDAVLDTLRSTVGKTRHTFAAPGQPVLQATDEERAVIKARDTALMIAEVIERACSSQLADLSRPAN